MTCRSSASWIKFVTVMLVLISWVFVIVPIYLHSNYGKAHQRIKEHEINTDALFYSESEQALQAIEALKKKGGKHRP